MSIVYLIGKSFIYARLLNVTYSFISVIFLYRLLKKITSKEIASLLCLFYSLQTSTVLIARQATYDQLSILLFIVGLNVLFPYLINETKNGLISRVRLIIANLLLYLAVLAKYTALAVLAPIFLLLIISKNRKNNLLYFLLPFLLFGFIFILKHQAVLEIWNEVTEKVTDRETVLNITLIFLNISIVPAIVGAITFIYDFIKILLSKANFRELFSETNITYLIIFAIIFTIPTFHLYTGIYTSYIKQTVYTVLGITLLIAYVVKQKKWSQKKILGLLIPMVIASFVININLYKVHDHVWPDTTKAEKVINNEIQGYHLILSEAANIYRVQAYDGVLIDWDNFIDLYAYEGSSKKVLTTLRNEIETKKYDYIIISGNYYSPEKTYPIRDYAKYAGYKQYLVYSDEVYIYPKQLFYLQLEKQAYTIEIWKK